jgi:hypothetical protein
LVENLRSMDFSMCYTSNDFWYRPATKADKQEYYEYVLVYTYDILAISTNPTDILATVYQHYMLNPNSIGPLTQYLGAQIGRYIVSEDPDKPKWYMSSEKYVKEAIRNVQNWLELISWQDSKVKLHQYSHLVIGLRWMLQS